MLCSLQYELKGYTKVPQKLGYFFVGAVDQGVKNGLVFLSGAGAIVIVAPLLRLLNHAHSRPGFLIVPKHLSHFLVLSLQGCAVFALKYSAARTSGQCVSPIFHGCCTAAGLKYPAWILTYIHPIR